jgi:hypothetical protein
MLGLMALLAPASVKRWSGWSREVRGTVTDWLFDREFLAFEEDVVLIVTRYLLLPLYELLRSRAVVGPGDHRELPEKLFRYICHAIYPEFIIAASCYGLQVQQLAVSF